jgi:hypothetical protein
MATIGLIGYELPVNNYDKGLKPGQTMGSAEHTTPFGCKIGVRLQMYHFTAHLKTDIVNWMRYTQFGCGYTFSFHKG